MCTCHKKVVVHVLFASSILIVVRQAGNIPKLELTIDSGAVGC